MNFEDHLNQLALNEIIHPMKSFEMFIKKYDDRFSFVSIINENISHEEDIANRYIVKSKPYTLQTKFLGIVFVEKKVIYHFIVSKIIFSKDISNSKKCALFVYGTTYFEILKKLVTSYISKNPDIIVEITLENVSEDFYVYDEIIEVDNIWKKFIRLFYRKNLKEN